MDPVDPADAKPWDPWVLAVSCATCKASPGQPCVRRGGPFHAVRIDRGLALQRQEHLERRRELDALL